MNKQEEEAIDNLYKAVADYTWHHYPEEQYEVAADILIAARLIFSRDELQIEDNSTITEERP